MSTDVVKVWGDRFSSVSMSETEKSTWETPPEQPCNVAMPLEAVGEVRVAIGFVGKKR
jgi:hypothetical protein